MSGGQSLLAALLIGACSGPPADAAHEREREPIVGLPCEGCEAVFEGLPAVLGPSSRIAPVGEPGEPLVIEGGVSDGAGRAVGGVIVYAYHTDASGRYPIDVNEAGQERFRGQAAYRHGRLRGWARTGEDGRYRFDTIRPAAYPDGGTPEHVHMHVIEPGRCTYYVDDVLFDDDQLLTDAVRRSLVLGRGGSGVAHPVRDAAGRWRVTRDLVLGAAIPGYPAE